jgi:hypothetical protein
MVQLLGRVRLQSQGRELAQDQHQEYLGQHHQQQGHQDLLQPRQR